MSCTAVKSRRSPANAKLRLAASPSNMDSPVGCCWDPKPSPTNYALPVVLTVTGKARGKLKEERLNVPIIIEKGQPVGYFTRVRRITFDIPEGSQVEDFKLFVSFDKDAEQQGGA